jgi:AcrR family transcriptional regulator
MGGFGTKEVLDVLETRGGRAYRRPRPWRGGSLETDTTMNPPRPLLSREFVLDHKRDRILAAIAELSAELGYEAMTITDIAARAHIARKTLYEAFGGKEAAFLAAVDAGFAALFERTEDACEADGGEWRERVRAGIAALLDHLAEHPSEAHMLIVAQAATTASAARYQVALARFTALLRDVTPVGDHQPEMLDVFNVGAVETILSGKIRRGEAERLGDLTDDLCNLVLAHWERPVR